MSLRPVSARWFEVIVPRMDSAHAAGFLANTGLVELEEAADHGRQMLSQDLDQALADYRDRVRRFGHYWKRGQLRVSRRRAPPHDILERALRRIDAWAAQAEPVIKRLQKLESEQAELVLWQDVLGCAVRRRLNLPMLVSCGPVLDRMLAVMPVDARLAPPAPALALRMRHAERDCLLVIAAADDLRGLHHEVRLLKGRVLAWPSWLRGQPREAADSVSRRLARSRREAARVNRRLDELHERFSLENVLGDLVWLEWFATRVGALPASDHLAWITGWTSDVSGERLESALEKGGVRALLHFPAAPAGRQPPQVLRNPWWVRPFETFSRGLGIPGHNEVDPSPWLAFLVPLLFGYMFGDVGQGLVLFVAGWLLKERWPLARLLLPAGLSAMVFGLLFGSVFSREDLLPALWLHPLQAPVTVLTVPLVLGVALLTLGQVLGALEAAWRGESRQWWLQDAGLLTLYLGAAGSLISEHMQLIAVAGMAWFLAGFVWQDPSVRGMLTAVGKLVEDVLRLLVNTVSFARVGAFALAHAGLSSAIVTLADAADVWWLAGLVLLLGNLLVILLEALVVSVQTTRLVLFEFFMRFLRAEGRPFRPLRPPSAVIEGESYETPS